MITREEILAVLGTILDPEMPVNLVDLGLIERVEVRRAGEGPPTGDAVDVEVEALPTFVGCPALDMIREEIELRVGRLPGVRGVRVRWCMDPPWSPQRITPAGRDALRAHGVTTPSGGAAPRPGLVPLTVSAAGGAGADPDRVEAARPCPFCGSVETQVESRFGPTRCRMICYCRACRNTFEHLKSV